MKKRLLASLLSAALIASMAPTTAFAAEVSVQNETVGVPAANALTNTTWTEAKDLTEDLVVEAGTSLTIGAPVTISGNVTISGGGIIQRGEDYTGILFMVPAGSTLTIKGVTIDGGAVWQDGSNTGKSGVNSILSVSGALILDGNCTLQNNDRGASSSGGAVYVDANGQVTVKQATIQNCAAKHGGAIYADQGKNEQGKDTGTGENLITIEDGAKLMNNNAANGAGGAIRTETGNLKISGGTIENNQSKTRGGGVDINGCIEYFEISGGQIQNNTTQGFGGGISFYSVKSSDNAPELKIAALRLTGNTAATSGGGIYMAIESASRYVSLSGVEVVNNSVSSGSNSFYGGGGIKFLSSQVSMKDCTVSGNRVAGSDPYAHGGGIDLKGAVLTAENLTVTSNSAKTGAGINLGANSSVLNTALAIKGKINIAGNTNSNLALTSNVVTVVGSISADSNIHINAPESSTPIYIAGEDSYQIKDSDYSHFTADGDGFSLKLDSANNRIVVQKATSWDVSAANTDSVKASVTVNDDDATLTLHITGTGAMQDYTASNKRPYYKDITIYGTSTKFSKEQITAVEIGDGVTHIGADAFASCSIPNVVLPSSVTSIASNTFAWNYNKPNENVVIVYINNNSIAWNLSEHENNIAKVFLNGGTFANGTTFKAGELATPTKESYTFAGWYTKNGENNDWGGKVDTPEAGKTYYAKWESRQLSRIEVTAKNATVPYGTVLGTDNFTVKAVYDNGESEEVTEYTIEPNTALTTLGKATVTVSYQGKTADCTITVVRAAQDTPAAPTLKTSDYTSITLNTVEANANGAKAQYSKDNGATWQDSPEFTGLTADTTYKFAVRYAETDTYAASESATAEFATQRRSSSSGSSSSTTTNTVTVPSTKNGNVTVNPKTASKGTTVTVTVTPDKGYTLDKLTVTDKNGKSVSVTKKSDTQYTFTMPDGKVDVKATFTEVKDTTPDTPDTSKSFVDVASSAWYADAVKYVTEKGLMNGTDDNQFSPNASTTRGMLMTVLARYAGEDTTGGATWYEKSMEWAKAKGVSDGTNPNANITREQLVTMLYRYAGSPKADGKLDSFSDAASVNTYAASAMQWACGAGIVNGSNSKLNPQNNASRAEVAAILMRFCEISK